MNTGSEANHYLHACNDPFWRQVFTAELDYLLRHLRPGDELLSVGCGPAIIESGLAEQDFPVIGLDISQEAIACTPEGLPTVVADAEEMPFSDARFDVVLFVVSLQFIENYRQALNEADRVLKPDGRVIVMLLNPTSDFFKEKMIQAGSYVRKIRHRDLHALEVAIAEWFEVQTEYFLGIAGNQIFPSHDPESAALYVIRGSKNGAAAQ